MLQRNGLTSVTRVFWGHRFMAEMEYPLMYKLTSLMRAEAKKKGQTQLMSLWCGMTPILR